MKAKERWMIRAAALVLVGGSMLVAGVESQAQAQVDVSAGLQINSPTDFYGPLARYGSWVDVNGYGRCWRPATVSAEWRPYRIGHWEWTDAGWYWVSDDPWAWACYHYGNWVLDPVYGWVWVPGTEWAPAWVAWREAPDYIGWAPCGPGGVAVRDSEYLFVDVHHFHDRLEPREFVYNDPAILRRSRPVGGFRREARDIGGARRQIAFNQGPSVDVIQRATGARIAARPVTELVRQTRVPDEARRKFEQTRNERRPTIPEQAQPSRTGRDQQPLYREPAQLPATGRAQDRIYREAPAPPRYQAPAEPQRAPAMPQAVTPPSAPAPVPRAATPPAPAHEFPRPPVEGFRHQPAEPAIPPVSPREVAPPASPERGRIEERQVPRRQEPPPAVSPAPSTPVAPVPPPRNERERQRETPGQ